jgi:hypothetical protein
VEQRFLVLDGEALLVCGEALLGFGWSSALALHISAWSRAALAAEGLTSGAEAQTQSAAVMQA